MKALIEFRKQKKGKIKDKIGTQLFSISLKYVYTKYYTNRVFLKFSVSIGFAWMKGQLN